MNGFSKAQNKYHQFLPRKHGTHGT